jgi:hypothetical protein
MIIKPSHVEHEGNPSQLQSVTGIRIEDRG